mmetsp:Transcript_15234/g.65231  ORF Transcript_15234/g.65231 Transcript_15234/m.65231 type:complete len:272 (+) Transcript_15234:567-1382(+)
MGLPSPLVLRSTHRSIAAAAEPGAPSEATRNGRPPPFAARRSSAAWHRSLRRQSSLLSADMFTSADRHRLRAKYRSAWIASADLALCFSAPVVSAARPESFAAALAVTFEVPASAYLLSRSGTGFFSGFSSILRSSATFAETASNALLALPPTLTTDSASSSSSASLVRSRSSFLNEYETAALSVATKAPANAARTPQRENVVLVANATRSTGNIAMAVAQDLWFARFAARAFCLRRRASRWRIFSASSRFAARSSASSSALSCVSSRSSR